MLHRDERVVPLFYSSKPRFTHRISNLSHRYSLTNASAVALWCRLSCVSVETSQQQCDWGITVAAMTGHSRRYRPAVLSNRHNHWLHAPARDRTFTRYSRVRSALFGTSSRSAGSTFPVVGATSAHAANARSCVTMLHDQNIAPAINVILIMHVDHRPLAFIYFLQRMFVLSNTLWCGSFLSLL